MASAWSIKRVVHQARVRPRAASGMSRARSGSYYSPLTKPGGSSSSSSSSSDGAAALAADTTEAGDVIPDPRRGSIRVSAEQEAVWFYQLPEDATLLQRLCEPLQTFRCFWVRLADAFGWRYVALVCCVYGVNQGVGEEMMGFATTRFWQDDAPYGLHMTALEQASAEGPTGIPWQIKALYGMMSDLWPILGFHFLPYLLISGGAGVVAWIGLGLAQPPTKLLAVLFLTLGNYAIASPDVIVDASVAQRSSTHPRLAADLQSLCWGSLSIGGLASTFVVAPIYGMFHAQGLFFAQAGTAAAIFVPALLFWLPEKREDSRCNRK